MGDRDACRERNIEEGRPDEGRQRDQVVIKVTLISRGEGGSASCCLPYGPAPHRGGKREFA